jgi:hypothetical protein
VRGGEARDGGGFHVYERRAVGGGEAGFFVDAGDGCRGGERQVRWVQRGCGEALAGADVGDLRGFGGRPWGEPGRAASG